MAQIGIPPTNPLKYTGPNVSLVPIEGFPRRPTINDKNWPDGQLVLLKKDPETGVQGELWYLAKHESNGDADWELLGTASPGGTVLSLGVDGHSAPGTDPVDPDVSGNIDITGGQVAAGTVGANVIRTYSSAINTLAVQIQRSAANASTDSTKNGVCHFDSAHFTVDANGFVQLTGGGMAVDSFTVQAATAPGVNPVVPAGTGIVTVNGAAVAAHSVPVETRTRAVNTYNVEVQYSSAVGATDATKSGLAHFDSSDFSVDANGFVSLNGTGSLSWQTITANQTLVANNGYICISPGGALTLTLPAAPTIGELICVTLDGATSFSLAQSAGQSVRFGNTTTTVGVGGSITSTAQGDAIWIVAQSATKFNVLYSVGNFTVV